MATERRDIALSIIADTKRYQQELAKIPNMTAKAASQASIIALKQQVKEENEKARIRKRAIADRLREEKTAERKRVNAAEKANREIESSYRDQFSAIKGLSGAAFGGVAGDLFDVADAAGGASLGMGAIGVALGALAVGAPLIKDLAAATLELGRSALEAKDSIEDEGLTIEGLISPAAATALNDYEKSQRDLGVAIDLATINLSLGLLPKLQELDETLIGLTPHAQVAGQALSFGVSAMTEATLFGVRTQLNQFSPVLGTAAEAAATYAKALLDAEGAALQLQMATEKAQNEAHAEFIADEAAAYEALGMSFETIEVETKKATKAQSAYVKAVKDGKIEISKAVTDEQAERMKAHRARQRFISESIADIDAEFQAEAEAERQLQLLEADRHEKKKQQRAEEKQMSDQRREELEQEMLALADLQGTVVGAMASFAELKFDETREGAADATDKTDRLKQEIQDLESTVEDANGTERQEIRATIRTKEDELKVAEDEAKKARQRARRQFKDMKALRISETIINGAAAASRAYVELGPVLGAIAAASIGIATAVNVATIKAQKPPKFHDGGMIQPDEQPAILRRGEAVLNERAAQRLGRQTIESLNRDEPLGNVNIYLGEDLLRSQRLQRTLRSGAHSAIGARSPYVGR